MKNQIGGEKRERRFFRDKGIGIIGLGQTSGVDAEKETAPRLLNGLLVTCGIEDAGSSSVDWSWRVMERGREEGG